jgi:hypothetical protein
MYPILTKMKHLQQPIIKGYYQNIKSKVNKEMATPKTEAIVSRLDEFMFNDK